MYINFIRNNRRKNNNVNIRNNRRNHRIGPKYTNASIRNSV